MVVGVAAEHVLAVRRVTITAFANTAYQLAMAKHAVMMVAVVAAARVEPAKRAPTGALALHAHPFARLRCVAQTIAVALVAPASPVQCVAKLVNAAPAIHSAVISNVGMMVAGEVVGRALRIKTADAGYAIAPQQGGHAL
jgi:hypothetical protein